MPNNTPVNKQYTDDANIYSGYALLSDELQIMQHSPMIAKWLKLQVKPYYLADLNPTLHAFVKTLVNSAKLDSNGWSHDALVLHGKRFECAINIKNHSDSVGTVHLFLSDHSDSSMEKTFLELAALEANIGSWQLLVPSQQIICSKNLYLLYGLAPDDELTFSLCKRFFSPQSLQKFEHCIEACKVGTAFVEIFELLDVMGQAKKIRISAKAIYDPAGAVTSLRGTMQDVTAHWYDTARYNLAIETAGIGVFEYDHTTSELIWNKHMYALYGKDPEQPISYVQWHNSVHPDDMDIAKTAFISSIKKGYPFSNIFRTVNSNGDIKYIKASVKTFVDEAKTPLKSIGVNIDITTLIEQEDQLALQRSLSLYNVKLAAIGEMAASIGHEINNPLAIAIGNLELLKSSIHKQAVEPPQLCNHLDAIDGSLARIQSIVAGLKHLAKDDSKEDKSAVNINDLLRITLTLFRAIYEKQGVNLIYTPNMSIQHVAVNGHVGELQQVLMNIINNARDAVTDSVRKDICLSVRLENKQVIIKITDTGIGIQKSLQSRIFDNFYSAKTSRQATGLGLAVVKRILADHKGSIEVESSPGEGASFIVGLPVIEVIKSSPENDSTVTFPLLKSRAITANFKQINAIVIDDEPLLLEIVANHLTSFGIKVLTTSKPTEVLDEILTGNYQLLVTDMCMPGCDGLNLIKQVKALSSKHPKCILMTGGVTADMAKDPESAYHHLDGILNKPFNRHALLKMLNGLDLNAENDNV
jgi:PAS domain S-box-containing protein